MQKWETQAGQLKQVAGEETEDLIGIKEIDIEAVEINKLGEDQVRYPQRKISMALIDIRSYKTQNSSREESNLTCREIPF